MIVKNEFLERRRVELAIHAEFKRHFCHSIGLTRSVDPKSVRFTLSAAHDAVQKWCGKEKQCARNQGKQRETSWIANTSYAPSVAPARDGCIKQNSSEREPNEYENAEIGEQFRAVI